MDAKQATMAVRDYFESIKKIKFFFEVKNVELDNIKQKWTVICMIQNVFEEIPHSFKVGVDNRTGDILYVKEITHDLSANSL
ncbi:MAG: hypothetical protein FIB08_01075 [Candidatus Methanoperedens sp.]|nr:hypothetical protein [Candidatus Methanoperedens sp.]